MLTTEVRHFVAFAALLLLLIVTGLVAGYRMGQLAEDSLVPVYTPKTTTVIGTPAHQVADLGPLYGGCAEWRPEYGPRPPECRWMNDGRR